MAKFCRLVALVCGTVSCMVGAAAAQTPGQLTPCGIAIGGNPSFATQGLTPVAGGLVYDSNQGLCWLADANPAGNPEVRSRVSLSALNPDGSTPVINPDGTMDWETALNFVNALNNFNGGQGWLDHNNWQLPTAQLTDPSCSSNNNGNFGVLCTGDAMGSLYQAGLSVKYPDSIVPRFTDVVRPFFNLQPGLYWTRSLQGTAGYNTFSFNSGDSGANTTNYNFFHVLPATHDLLGTVAFGSGVLPYISGPGAGKAVYDTSTGLSWPINANLAAEDNFGFTATTVLTSSLNGMDLTVPMIDEDGAMHFSALCDLSKATNADPCPTPASGWIVSMNQRAYAGSSNWTLPRIEQIQALYDDLTSQGRIQPGDTHLEWKTFVGPFWRLQPGFYWMCERDDLTPPNPQAPCAPNLMPGDPGGTPMAYSFNFDDGFLGTDHLSKHFFVMVYFPAPAAGR